ncbi:MAG TPA: hypothetical protein VK465_03540 [Fibrobacteria bacterium]|nr:hypothetical protein [Fibrobacteria bacterium]
MKQAMMGWMAVGVLGAAMAAEAHVGSLSIKGGEKYKVGQVVNVSLNVVSAHSPNKFDLTYSTNGGTSFEKVETKTATGGGVKTFAWTVPNKPSTTAQFKICQWDDNSNTDKTCAYKVVSPNFTIEAATTGLSQGKSLSADSRLGFETASGKVMASFTLTAPAKVLIQAFTLKGELVSTLLDEVKGPGAHNLNFDDVSLSSSLPKLFRMSIGDEVTEFKAAGR